MPNDTRDLGLQSSREVPPTAPLLSARSEIENVLALYAWTFDMDQIDQIGECFTGDAEVEFIDGLQVGRAAIVANLEARRALFRADGVVPWHVLSSTLIRSETDLRAEATCFWTLFVKPENAPPQPHSLGYYADVFVNDGGVWRVSRRQIVGGGRP